jgi:hypothetical protein
MPQIYDNGPPALLPLRRKACWGFFRPEKSDGFANLGTRGQHASSRSLKRQYHILDHETFFDYISFKRKFGMQIFGICGAYSAPAAAVKCLNPLQSYARLY